MGAPRRGGWGWCCGVTSRSPSCLLNFPPRCLHHGGDTRHPWVPRCQSQSGEGHPAPPQGDRNPRGCTHGWEGGAGGSPCQGSPIVTPMSLVPKMTVASRTGFPAPKTVAGGGGCHGVAGGRVVGCPTHCPPPLQGVPGDTAPAAPPHPSVTGRAGVGKLCPHGRWREAQGL